MPEPTTIMMGMSWCQDGERFQEILTYPFVKCDGGRVQSKRPRQTNDCTVRALAIATGADYDVAYDTLKEAGRKCSRGFHFRKWAAKHSFNGFAFEWMPFPAVKGQRRMNPATFCKQFAEGRYIVKTAKHVFAIIDGVVHDSWEQRADRCIYGCWKVTPHLTT